MQTIEEEFCFSVYRLILSSHDVTRNDEFSLDIENALVGRINVILSPNSDNTYILHVDNESARSQCSQVRDDFGTLLADCDSTSILFDGVSTDKRAAAFEILISARTLPRSEANFLIADGWLGVHTGRTSTRHVSRPTRLTEGRSIDINGVSMLIRDLSPEGSYCEFTVEYSASHLVSIQEISIETADGTKQATALARGRISDRATINFVVESDPGELLRIAVETWDHVVHSEIPFNLKVGLGL